MAGRYEAQFSLFDTSGDGFITPAELGAAMRGLGRHVSDAQLQKMVSDVDENGTGWVNFDGFSDAHARASHSMEGS